MNDHKKLTSKQTNGAETVEVIREEDCCPILKPMPMMTGRDGQHYTPLQAMGHVLGLKKQSVDITVGAIRTAASVVADKAQAAQGTLATIFEGETCYAVLSSWLLFYKVRHILLCGHLGCCF